MIKSTVLALILYALFTIAIFSQTKDSRLDEFIGVSKNSISNIWGYPAKTEKTSDGYLKYTYYVDNVARTFFFDSNNRVEMAGSIVVITSHAYAKDLAYTLGETMGNQGFWIYDQQENSEGSLIITTNGNCYIDIRIFPVGNNYGFSLLAYR